MSRTAMWTICAIAAAALVALAARPSGAAGVAGRSYTYTTLEETPESGCGLFDDGGVFIVDVDGVGYEGTWRQRRFRRRSFFRADVYHMGVHYFTNGRMKRNGSIIGVAYETIDGGWIVRYTGEDTGCVPIAPL